MPNIIYQKTPGQLIKQGDRTVSTFPSGLIRVDQSFICATTDAESHRSLLPVESNFPGGNEPSIDGIYVYPEIQEKRQSDGFTELIVSGYGRTKTTLQDQKKTVETVERVAYGPISEITGEQLETSIFVSYNVISGYIVIEKNSGLSVSDLGFQSDFFNHYNITSTSPYSNAKVIDVANLPQQDLYSDWNGDLLNRFYTVVRLQITTALGFVLPDLYNYTYASPVINVINRLNCGKFVELEIQVK